MEKEIAELKNKLKEHEERISALEKLSKIKPKITYGEKKGTEALLLELKDEGFFNEEKRMSQIRDALHVKGRIVKLTDLPPYLLKLVRNKVLKRDKREVGKKKAWVYFA